jgi:hypothetical protein
MNNKYKLYNPGFLLRYEQLSWVDIPVGACFFYTGMLCTKYDASTAHSKRDNSPQRVKKDRTYLISGVQELDYG